MAQSNKDPNLQALSVPCGPSLDPTDEATSFASRQKRAEVRKLFNAFFSSLRGVDGNIKQVNFHSRKFPMVDRLLNLELERETVHSQQQIDAARERGDHDLADHLEDDPISGPAYEIGKYNKLDNTWALPMLIIDSKRTLPRSGAAFAEAALAHLAAFHAWEDDEEFKSYRMIYPRESCVELLSLKILKLVTGDSEEELEKAVKEALKKYVPCGPVLKDIYGEKAYN